MMRPIWKDEAIGDDQPLWRYMRPARFLDAVDGRQLYFASVQQFEDPFEGAVAVVRQDLPVDPRYAEMERVEKAFKELRRLCKASCWHLADYESDAMWRLYSGDRKGVAIRTTVQRLRTSLLPFRLAPHFGEEVPYFGTVRYQDLHSVRLRVGMEERFFHKHRAFEWEREFRVLFTLRSAEEFGVNVPTDGINVPFDPEGLIETVWLGPDLDPTEANKVAAACAQIGCKKRVVTTTLLGRPRYI